MSPSLSPTLGDLHGSEERSRTAPRSGNGIGERSREKDAEVGQKHAGPRERGKMTSEAPGGSGTSSPTTETEKSAPRTTVQSMIVCAKEVSSSPTPGSGVSSHNYDINLMSVGDVIQVFVSIDAPSSVLEQLQEEEVDGPKMEHLFGTEETRAMRAWLGIEMDVWAKFSAIWRRIQECTRESAEEKDAPRNAPPLKFDLGETPAEDEVTTHRSRVSEPGCGSVRVTSDGLFSGSGRDAPERVRYEESEEPEVRGSPDSPDTMETIQALLKEFREMERERVFDLERLFGAHTEAAERRIAVLEKRGGRKNRDADSESSDEEGEKVYAKDVCPFPKGKEGVPLMSKGEWRNWVYQASNWCTPESSDYADRIMKLHDDARLGMEDLVKNMSKAERKMDVKMWDGNSSR